jgi:hypothetical protein
VIQKIVLRRIFGTKREEVARGCRRLHNDKLHILHVSSNIVSVIKEDETGEAWSMRGRCEKCIQNFVWRT